MVGAGLAVNCQNYRSRSIRSPIVPDPPNPGSLSACHSEIDCREERLTPRQCEVAQLLAEGKSMKGIADVLHVTPRTIAFHKYKTMEDQALKSTAELIQFAIKNRIVVA
jgi:DNA-binding NarL/FixJ family response regulator